MSDDIRITSSQLSEILEHVVGTNDIIKCRRMVVDMLSRVFIVPETNHQMYVVGSRCDGLALESSDGDGMRAIKSLPVSNSGQSFYENDQMLQRSDHLLVLNSPSATSYVCIDLHIRRQYSISQYLYQMFKVSSIYYNERLLLSSSLFLENNYLKNSKSGPALSNVFGISIQNDYVTAFHCKVWPFQAYEWVNRNRHYSSPNSKVISLSISIGHHLVPIGEPYSNMTYFQWRVSFVLQECLLVRRFSQMQLKMYALVKMINSECLSKYKSPTTGDPLITSYHIKTLMFWIIENTPCYIWKVGNMIRCIQICFRYLKHFLKCKFMPHYFVPTCNLFKKHTSQDAPDVQNVINDLCNYIKKPLRVIFALKPVIAILPSFINDGERIERHTFFQIGIHKRTLYHLGAMFVMCHDVVTIKPNVIVATFQSTATRTNNYDFQLTYAMLVRSLAYRLSQNTPTNDNKSVYVFERKLKCISVMHSHMDFSSGWLQIATYLYKTGQYEKSVAVICKHVITQIEQSPQTVYCGNALDKVQLLHIYLNYDICSFRRCIESTCPYLILLHNANVPNELDTATKLWEDIGLQILDVTPLPYAYFLTFLCAHMQNDTSKQLSTLHQLKSTLNSEMIGIHIRHDLVEFIVLNMVGICYEIMGDSRNAEQYYREATNKTHLYKVKLAVAGLNYNMKMGQYC